MSKFAQGPWIFDDEYIFTANRGMMIAEVMAVREKEFNANGRLIATAPDMYNFIKKVAIWAHYYLDSRFVNLFQEAQELLARIDGEEEKHE